MKKFVGAFFAACVGLAALSHGYAQIGLPWPGPGAGAGGVAACSITGGTTSTVNGQNAYHWTSGSGTINCSTTRVMYYLAVGGGGGGACGLVGGSLAGGAGGGAGGGVQTGLISFPTGSQGVTVGAGGAGCPTTGTGTGVGSNGSNTTVASITAQGGGAGIGYAAGAGNIGNSGASGGGNGGTGSTPGPIGGLNVSGQGFLGGTGNTLANYPGGGGGGAGGNGGNATTTVGGAGGPGLQSAISGSLVSYGCGAGGSTYAGGTAGAQGCSSAGTSGVGNVAGTAATGQGSGGGSGGGAAGPVGAIGGAGAAGEVWLVEATPPITACAVSGGPSNLAGQVNGNVVYQFNAAGTLQCPTARQVNYVLIAGGGSGGNASSLSGSGMGAGGGAGGVKAGAFQIGTSAYNITIGAGGTPGASGSNNFGGNGGSSTFGSLPPAIGGGGGGAGNNAGAGLGQAGGSQGGTARATAPTTGNTVGQGNLGGSGNNTGGTFGQGGGGGPGGVGGTGTTTAGGNGGLGYFIGQNFFGGLCIAGGGAGGTDQTGSAGKEGQGVCGGAKAGQGGGDNPGAAGSSPGSGGGGASGLSTVTGLGGVGANGALYVSHPLTPSTTNICVANTQGGGTDANVTGLWHFDQLTADASGNGKNGTLSGTGAFSLTQNKFGGYSLLPGSGGTMDVPALATMPGDFTIEGWIYLTSTFSTSQDYVGSDNNATFEAGVSSGVNRFWTPGINNSWVASSTFATGQWYHYAWVRNGTTGTNINLFINGTFAGTPTGSFPMNTTIGASTTWSFGSRTTASTTAAFTNGYMDEVRVSNMARYPGTSNFTAPTLPFCDPVPGLWSTSDKSTGITLSNNSQTATQTSGGSYHTVLGTKGLTTGKWYWELLVNTAATVQLAGIADGTTRPVSGWPASSFYCGTVNNSAGWRNTIGLANYYLGAGMTSDSAAAVTFANGDILMLAVDITAGKAWLGRNGTWLTNTGGVGNPAAGTNQSYHWTPAGTWYPCWTGFDAGVSVTLQDGFVVPVTNTPPTGFSLYGNAP